MKKLVLVSIAVAGFGLAGVSSTAAAAPAIDSSTEYRLVKVCKALKSNSRLQLAKAVKQSGYTYRMLAKGLVCNGKDAVEFAMFNGAESTANLFARKGRINIDGMLAKN